MSACVESNSRRLGKPPATTVMSVKRPMIGNDKHPVMTVIRANTSRMLGNALALTVTLDTTRRILANRRARNVPLDSMASLAAARTAATTQAMASATI